MTPFVTYRFGGALSVERGRVHLASAPAFGAAIGYDTEDGTRVEVRYEQQISTLMLTGTASPPQDFFDVVVRTVHAGAVYGRPIPWARPYLVASVGVTLLDPRQVGRDQAWGLSGSGGAGLEWPPAGPVAVRVESRLWLTAVNGPEALFCQSGSGCFVAIRGPLLWQGQLSAGASVRF